MSDELTLVAGSDDFDTNGIVKRSDSFMSEAFEPGLVSVIIPVYNRRHFIVEALNSVAAQTYRPIEAIVVDDGSIDGTAEAAHDWYRNLQPTRREGLTLHVIIQENGGAPKARNRGLAKSVGEFIQFLDSDDILVPEKLEVHVASLRANPELEFVYSSAEPFGLDSKNGAGRTFGGPESLTIRGHLSRKGNALNTWLGLCRRELCRRVGPWDERMRVWIDGEYNLRILLSEARIAYIPGIFLLYRVHEGDRLTGAYPSEKHVDALEIAFETLITRAEGDALRDGVACFADQCRSITFHAICRERWLVANRAIDAARRIDDGPWQRVLFFMLRWSTTAALGRILAARLGRALLVGVRRLRTLR